MKSKNIIIQLFNLGKLKLVDAYWYKERGYSIICEDGKVSNIIKESEGVI